MAIRENEPPTVLMHMKTKPIQKKAACGDQLVAFALVIILLLLAHRLTPALPGWEDDYAAYLNEGIAIADGRFDEQIKLNVLLHLAETPNPAKGDTLVYAWGYPLLTAGFYRIFGFDRSGLTSIASFKWISCVGLGLFAGTVYLLFRKRFCRAGALLGALLCGIFSPIFCLVSEQYSDICFCAWVIVCFLLLESALDAKTRTRSFVYGILFGLAAGFAKALRLNGSTVLLVFAIAWAERLIREKKGLKNKLLLLACVIAAFLVFDLVMNRLILARATSNIDDFSGLSLYRIAENARFYAYTVRDWLADTLTFGFKGNALVKVCKYLATTLIGIATIGVIPAFKREKYLLTFTLVTLLGCIALPYTQGGRYVFPLIPVLFLLIGYGLALIGKWIGKLLKRFPPKKATIVFFFVFTAFILCTYGVRAVKTDNPAPRSGSPYCQNALDCWAYINDELPEDVVIFTQKPRLVYLNTGRLAYAPVYGHTWADCDYLLDVKHYAIGSLFEVTDAPKERMTPVFKCNEAILYRIEPDN